MYALLLCDLDGTLIDSAPDLRTAVRLALADLRLPAPGIEEVRRMVGAGQRVLMQRALAFAGGDPALVDEALARYRHHYSQHLLEKTTLYPGVAETLRALPAGLCKAVATNKPGAWSRAILDGLGLLPLFRFVLGEDDVGRRKPDPFIVHEICRRAEVPPARALFVGDSGIDAATARAAGMDMVLCRYGYGDSDDPATLAQENIRRIDGFAELLPLLLPWEGP